MASTKKPSGLSIKRDGNLKFVFGWKIADKDYGGGQELRYRIWTSDTKHTSWTSLSIGKTSTSKTVTISTSNYYPNASKYIFHIEFEVRGKRAKTTSSGKTTNYDWSAWESKKWKISVPPAPSITDTLDLSNKTTFAWTVNKSDEDSKPFHSVEYQSILVKNCTETDGSKLTWKSSQDGWDTGTGSATGSKSYTENSVLLAADSYTRWIRIRSRGAGGNGDTKGVSAWKYKKHVYAKPYTPEINSATATANGGVTTCTVKWTAGSDAAHPIDETAVYYTIATPAAGRTCPNNASWTEVNTSKDTSGKDGATFSINTAAGQDECMFVRISVKHDSNMSYSAAKLVDTGALAAPTITSCQTDGSQFKVTIAATNASDVPDSQMAVVFRNGKKDTVIAIIAHGSTTATGVKCPEWTSDPMFGVYAFSGSYKSELRADGVTEYTVTAKMKSGTTWTSATCPVEPKNVTVAMADTPNEVIITWDWTWSNATEAEVSWSDNPNAWESTEQPSTYTVSQLHDSRLRVSSLEAGKAWYFRVRLIKQEENSVVYGPYSDIKSIVLSSAPGKPALKLSDAVVTPGRIITATWGYISTDNTDQIFAAVCLATKSGSTITYGDVIAHTETAQSVSIDTSGWTAGTTYYLCVKVTSGSGKESEWSDPIALIVAPPVTCTITATSLTSVTVTDSDGNTRSVTGLTAMPLTVTATGAGEGGKTTLAIERAEDYHMIRPDESDFDGYEGETIAVLQQSGQGQMQIDVGDLVGVLDDGGSYRLIVISEDSYGQKATAVIFFEVHWTHQAGIPSIGVITNDMQSLIMPVAPPEYAAGDVCDIYRLSADKPELIVKDGTFGALYVDPYPAIGEHAGHRVVHKTINGDYITADNHPAWIDSGAADGDFIDEYSIIIDFSGKRLILPYDIGLTNRWAKDFQATRYLGGSIKGDWNPTAARTGTYTVSLVVGEDDEMIKGMRDLAAYCGICHIRTPEGSSYAADIQVSEAKKYSKWDTIDYTITATKVDTEELDGLPYVNSNLFVATNVIPEGDELVVEASDEMQEFATFEVNEENGTLEVTLL